ncbi:hypothetical protein GCM10007415_22530 [Parapedobacter pyrenivorans]|uniref:KilA-N DNA-binding domain-containing protein n=1 Tax=Parapedobacter pyrenivorans TaxID=1305674 RepID=A0A917HSG3_9SPHI|nr:ORF6N domain-containing protein [Parapedobacter pyrenivorans]GGG88080.1 hypothetical protein GCM10007415_22530 [Parapedobacter pyrenivorans]
MAKTTEPVSLNEMLAHESDIQDRIFNIRGIQVMIDRDLAELYGVETKALNQAVKRNTDRFPEDFRFQLSNQEKTELVTICDRFESLKHATVNPHAYTEHGVLMLANVLKSDLATQISIRLVKVFVQLRSLLASHTGLQLQIEEIKNAIGKQNNKLSNHDKTIELLFQYLDELNDKIKRPPLLPDREMVGYKIGRGKDKN